MGKPIVGPIRSWPRRRFWNFIHLGFHLRLIGLGESGSPPCGCLCLSLIDSLVPVMARETKHRYEQKLNHLEEALFEVPPATTIVVVRNAYTCRIVEQKEELKTMFYQYVEQELFETVNGFHACKQDEGQFVSTYVLKMKGYLDQMERLGYPMPLVLLNAMLKLAEKGIPKKSPAVLVIREGHIQKPKQQARGKGKKLNKNKASTSSTSRIFTIELYSFPKTNFWIYDIGCGTHICNIIKGLKGIQNLNRGALDLYVGNSNCATVKAIGSFDLILPSGMGSIFPLISLGASGIPPGGQLGLSLIDSLVPVMAHETNHRYEQKLNHLEEALFEAPPATAIVVVHNAYTCRVVEQQEVACLMLSKKGIDIYMLVEKEYPSSKGTLTLMLVAKLLVDQDNEMSKELLRKIFIGSLPGGCLGLSLIDSLVPVMAYETKHRYEQTLNHFEEALFEAPPATAIVVVHNAYTCRIVEQQEVACLMLSSMTPKIQKNLKDHAAFDIL
ncbi:hypothetical protein Tco_0000298 [Tanacetum coccineum]